MARIMAVDYGLKRCGIATTDPFQIIVTGLDTVGTEDLMDFLLGYTEKEDVTKIVFGFPTHKDGNPTYVVGYLKGFVKKFKQNRGNIIIDYVDENFTSFEAKQIILKSGVKKKKRRDKTLIDKVSAILILQKYLGHI